MVKQNKNKKTVIARPPLGIDTNPYGTLDSIHIYAGMPPYNEDLPLAGSCLMQFNSLKCEFDISAKNAIVQLEGTNYNFKEPKKVPERFYFYEKSVGLFVLCITKKKLFFDVSFLGEGVKDVQTEKIQLLPMTWGVISKLSAAEILIIWNDLK